MKKEKKEFKKREILRNIFLVFLFGVCFLTAFYLSQTLFAWLGPTQNPPGGNVDLLGNCDSNYVLGTKLDYSLQSEINYDDYRENFDPGYTRPFVSTWTKAYGSPEVWKDERTGLHWSPRPVSGATNSFVVGDCNFFSMPRGTYTGDDPDCGNAINYCGSLNGSNYGNRTGWYLPTQDELIQAYLNGMSLTLPDIGGFTLWSSSEWANATLRAWMMLEANGALASGGLKSVVRSVRCVTRESCMTSSECFNAQVGDVCGGGVVAYNDGYCGGLIAAAADQGTSQWGCEGSSVGSTTHTIGSGAANTSTIVNFHSGWVQGADWGSGEGVDGTCHASNNGTVAARVCSELSLNGHDDWYLPSWNELNELYTNRVAVGGFHTDGLEPTYSYYWSSTEYWETPAVNAVSVRFLDGTSGIAPKQWNFNVRCVRSF